MPRVKGKVMKVPNPGPGLSMSTPCLNNALQACVISSYWESSLALAYELNAGSFLPYAQPDLISSNLQLAALTVSHQWKHALHLLKHQFSGGKRLNPSTFNTHETALSGTLQPGDAYSTGSEEDMETGIQDFRDHLFRCLIESAWDIGFHGLPVVPHEAVPEVSKGKVNINQKNMCL